ncbi:restriction endonuclease subunit S [Methanoculleus sp.]|uniref:restriction endonuclease subunit S n=1 Tax=Methanoculleus sp. TaxID=90427 RepID=UPI001BD66A5B|nr:restriction endonuclease subunit S [Methanoculleus sp.]
MSDIPEGYKLTKAGVIPEEWYEGTVSDLFHVVTGTTPSTSSPEYWEDGTLLWITPTDLSTNNGQLYIFNCERKITDSAVRDYNLNRLPVGSIIVSTRAPVGYVALNRKVAYINQGCKGLIPKENVSGTEVYYSYYLKSRTSELTRVSGGSTFKELSKQSLESFPIPIPQNNERRRIATILSAVDAAITATDEVIAKTEELKRGLMQVLLVKGVDEDGRVRSEETHTFCEKKVGSKTLKFPESWKFKNMGDVITLKRGYDLPSDERVAGEVPVISSSGVSGYHQEAKVCGPSVVTGRYGTLGEVFFIERDFWPLNTTLYVCNFKDNDPKFISYFLKLHLAAYQSDALSIPGINRNFVHRLPCAVPPPPEQHHIAAVLSTIDRDLAAERDHRARLQTLKKGLMQDLLTGRKRVPLNGGEGHDA